MLNLHRQVTTRHSTRRHALLSLLVASVPFTMTGQSEPSEKRAKYTPRRTDAEKLAHIFHALKVVDWSLGHFLYHAFRRMDNGDQCRSRTSYADKFLKGKNKYGVGEILSHSVLSNYGFPTCVDIFRRPNHA